MPSLADLEQWMEEQLPPNLHDLPMKVTTTIQSYSSHLYSQLSDLTPSYSQIESSIESSLHSIPFVGSSVSPPPPPPPPVPTNIVEAMMRRADAVTGNRTRTSIVAGVAVVGITCAVLTRSSSLLNNVQRSPKIQNGSRQEMIIVLGADTPLGQSLCHYLSAQGFIVLASVANEQSMQAFDSLIPPSSRGYIKSIVLDSTIPRAEEINYFVRSVASAKELRWPLTSAGDPYSRPGTEVEVAGLVNTMSYKLLGDHSSTSSMHVDHISKELNQRVVTPLATIKALLPLLASGPSINPSFVVSLTASDGELSTQALLAGMEKLQEEMLVQSPKMKRRGSQSPLPSRKGRVLFTTIEAQPSSLRSLFISLLPSSVGGAAPLTHRRQEDGTFSTPSSRVAMDTRGNILEKPTRPRNSTRSSSSSEIKIQRESEYKVIFEALTSILLMPATTKSIRSKYSIRLPASASSLPPTKKSGEIQENRGLERTLLLQIVKLSYIPVALFSNVLSRMRPSCWWTSLNRSNFHYSGSRNPGNSRPAYGPGPGPASNTHSRSCIREQPGQGNSRSSGNQRRPASAHSTSSSEATRSTESSGAAPATSGPGSIASAASGPPSNNGLSSSGLLSSVPSSAFGDVSDHEHFDYEVEADSPVQDGGPWASPNLSDHDSDTALGPRPQDYSSHHEEVTPHGSQIVEGGEEVQYGFPSQASMQSSGGEEAWMGPAGHHDGTSLSKSQTSNGNSSSSSSTEQSQLGQSWVALGQSQLEESTKVED